VCFSTAALIAVAAGAPVWIGFAAWSLGGTGVGLGYPTISLVALASARPGEEGAVSSATALAAIVGMLLGIFACGIPVFVAGHANLRLAPALVYTFGVAFVLSAGLAALASRLPRDATAR
jgi:hypothetical protein